MSADIALGDFVLEKYDQLACILKDLIHACQIGKCPEQEEILQRVKRQTNHTGLHYTEQELAFIFLGRELSERN